MSFRLKGVAGSDELDEIAEAVAALAELGHEALNLRPIGSGGAPACGVGKHFACQRSDKLLAALDEDFLEVLDAIEFLAAGQLAGGIDRGFSGVAVAPLADGVEMLQREAEWIDLAMAVVAACVVAVLFELLADRFGP